MHHDLKHLTVVAGMALTFALAPSAQAQLYAYEGFDYTPGVLAGNNGGTGWNGAWALNGGNANNSVVLPNSFTYQDSFGRNLVVSGGRAHVTGDGSITGDDLLGGTVAGSQPLRLFDFSRGLSGNTESTWISLLALRTGLPNPTPGADPNDFLYGRAVGAQFFYQSSTATTAGNEQFSFGRATQSSETAHPEWQNDAWSVSQQGNANAQKVSDLGFAGAPADFLLVRIDHVAANANDAANADTIRMWINPPNLKVIPSDGSADITFNANEYALATGVNRDFVFNRFRLFAGNPQTTPSGRSYGSLEIDELRIGGTFYDVAAIPEPSLALLGGMGALLLVVFRKRQAI